MTAVSLGCAASTAPNGPGPVCRPGSGPLPQCTTTGTPASASMPHTSSSSRVARVEVADLHVHLEHARPRVERGRGRSDAAAGSG